MKKIILVIGIISIFLVGGCGTDGNGGDENQTNQESSIISVFIDGVEMKEFDENQYDYTFILGNDVQKVPEVVAIQIGDGEMLIEQAQSTTGEALITLNEKVYTIRFLQTDRSVLLNNTYYRLNVDKKLKVAYIGGSVTYGFGASDPAQQSWASLTTAWLKTQYPDAQIDAVNVGIGGTGSEFGAYRIIQDLELQNRELCPDLFFVEFSINDVYDNCDSKVYMESIIRSIYQYAPSADIVLVFTTDFSRQNTEYTALVNQKAVADAYQIPYIHVGAELWDDIVQENNGTAPESVDNPVWKKYFTDIVHPKDTGYEKYASYITTYLSELFAKKETVPISLQEAYWPKTSISQVPVAPHIVNFAGQKFTSNSIALMSDGSITSFKEGTSFTVEFTGTELKLWVMGSTHGGTLDVSVDGEEYSSVNLYKNSTNHLVVPVVANLPAGTHEVTFTLQASPAGSDMDIRYLMISGSEFEGVQVK